jgi:anti-sigma B factor antagonist
MSDFSLRVTTPLPGTPDVALVAFSGKLGVSNARTLDSALENLRTHGQTKVVLDLSGANYLNSGALGVILRHVDLFREAGGGFALLGLSPKIAIVVEMLGLKETLGLHKTLDEALATLGAC